MVKNNTTECQIIPQVCHDDPDTEAGLEVCGRPHGRRGGVHGLHGQPPGIKLLQIFTLQVGVVSGCRYDPTLLSHIFNMTRRDF